MIIGAGFIGLEFAATARVKGLEVDVLELAPRVMARAVTAEVSEYFQARHREAGIRIHLGVQATSIEAENGKVTGVSLSDGRHLPADLVVVACIHGKALHLVARIRVSDRMSSPQSSSIHDR